MKDIKTDKDLIEVLDELKHRLKAGQPLSLFRTEFNERLDDFIDAWGLASDPHAFVALPENWEEK